MFYPNDRWELSFRRKCQRSSQGGSLGWTWWVLIMLNKIDSDESICAIEAVPMSSKVCFQTGGVPGSRFPSQSESYLCLASPPPPPPWYLACFFFFFFKKPLQRLLEISQIWPQMFERLLQIRESIHLVARCCLKMFLLQHGEFLNSLET